MLLGREIFGSMVPWVTKYILNSLWNPPTPPSYILNVSSVTSGRDDGRVMQFLKKLTADWTNYLSQIKLCLQWLKQRTWGPYDWSIPFIYRSIMPAFTGPNKLFQRESPKIFSLYNHLHQFLKTWRELLTKFVKSNACTLENVKS